MRTTPLLVPQRPFRLLVALLLSALCPLPTLAAAKIPKAKLRGADGDAAVETTAAKPGKREDAERAKSARADAGATEARLLARLREHLGVTDDAEWAVIAERIAKVEELGRSAGRGPGGARGVATLGAKIKRNGRAGGSADPEIDALRAAVSDQYPDAEIKARLARVHEVFEQQRVQLVKAQADLRAVLSVRQEAMLVMVGVLPP